MRLLAAVLSVVAVWPATAHAEGRVEAAERKMTAAYGALVGRLDGPAKAHLEADQARWLADRRSCDAAPPRRAECLEARYRSRAELLAAVAKAPYPFISLQAIVRSGIGKDGRYSVDVTYPRFDGRSADFAGTNRLFAEQAQALVAEATDIGRDSEAVQTFSLYRPTASVVSVNFWREWVGATISIDLAGYLVDLSTGRVLAPQDVFAPGDAWRHRLAHIIGQELAKDPPDPDRRSEASDVGTIMSTVEAKDYLFKDDRLVLSLNKVGSERGMKGYTVDIAYAALTGILRADGPLGSLHR